MDDKLDQVNLIEDDKCPKVESHMVSNIPNKEATPIQRTDESTPKVKSRGKDKKTMTTLPSTKLELRTPRFSQEDKGKAKLSGSKKSPIDLTENNPEQVTKPNHNVTRNGPKILFKKNKFGGPTKQQ